MSKFTQCQLCDSTEDLVEAAILNNKPNDLCTMLISCKPCLTKNFRYYVHECNCTECMKINEKEVMYMPYAFTNFGLHLQVTRLCKRSLDYLVSCKLIKCLICLQDINAKGLKRCMKHNNIVNRVDYHVNPDIESIDCIPIVCSKQCDNKYYEDDVQYTQDCVTRNVWSLGACNNCCRYSANFLSCDKCDQMYYCSEKCKSEHVTKHQSIHCKGVPSIQHADVHR